MRIAIDPRTGALVAAPVGVAVTEPALSTSATGLVAEIAPGGGVMVNLQGRFRSSMTATIGPDGTLVATCHTEGAAAPDVPR